VYGSQPEGGGTSINGSAAKHCCNIRRRQTPRGTLRGTLRRPKTVPSRFWHSPGFDRAHLLRVGNGRADSVRAPQSGPFLRTKVAEQFGFAVLNEKVIEGSTWWMGRLFQKDLLNLRVFRKLCHKAQTKILGSTVPPTGPFSTHTFRMGSLLRFGQQAKKRIGRNKRYSCCLLMKDV